MIKIRAATDDDLEVVEQLLSASDLPVEGVPENFRNFLVAEDGDAIAGAIGFERFGPFALLRSAVISPDHRGIGIGGRLVEELLSRATEEGINEIYLLTTTAEEYFPRFGFARTKRSAVPAPLKASAEFQGACPDTATVMSRSLGAPVGSSSR